MRNALSPRASAALTESAEHRVDVKARQVTKTQQGADKIVSFYLKKKKYAGVGCVKMCLNQNQNGVRIK